MTLRSNDGESGTAPGLDSARRHTKRYCAGTGAMGACDLSAKRAHAEGGHALLVGGAIADAGGASITAAARSRLPEWSQTEAVVVAGANTSDAVVIVVEAPRIDAAVARADPGDTVVAIEADSARTF